MIRTIIFDYDGTLHDSSRNYIEAFKSAYAELADRGMAKANDFHDQEILRWMGCSAKDMWEGFMPWLPEEEKNRASIHIGEILCRRAAEGRAVLYEGALDILKELKERGYKLVFLSNCDQAYMDAHIQGVRLDRYFDGFYCGGNYHFAPKYEIFTEIKNAFPDEYAVVGDRCHDMEIGKHHFIFTVGCLYGFGDTREFTEADCCIRDVREILNIFQYI